MSSYIEAAEKWLAQDFDTQTQTELQALIDSADEAALDEAFHTTLNFGTAGLRGVLGPGPNRMNQLMVARVSYALGQVLHSSKMNSGIVVGFDGRHNSEVFARLTEAILTAQGHKVYSFQTYAPTPLVAYAVTALKASAGVVVTASHNPPEYNGYKVYWSNGAQIISPIDKEIKEVIDKTTDIGAINRQLNEELLVDIEDFRAKYIDDVVALSVSNEEKDLSIIYTPLHGVGAGILTEVFKRAGFKHLHTVPAQTEPDPDFSTVKFPNPEEEGALDLAIELAKEKNAELIIANDPDADRLASVIRDDAGSFISLDGNQIGMLLAYYLLSKEADLSKCLVINTVVSTMMLADVAKAMGAQSATTLTGFKWIANKALELEKEQGTRFVIGFEEALGSTSYNLVRDKDGISAALLFACLASEQKQAGSSVYEYLLGMYRRFGLYQTRQRSITLKGHSGLQQISDIMGRIRSFSDQTIGSEQISVRADLEKGEFKNADQYRGMPAANVIIFHLGDSKRVIARPSGTEPKLKIYYEVKTECDDYQKAHAEAEANIDALDRLFCETFAIDH